LLRLPSVRIDRPAFVDRHGYHRIETHCHPFPFRFLKYPEAGHTILVPYWPLSDLRVLTLARVEGMQDYLLFQGGTAKADAEAGVDAWRDLLAFLDDATKAHGS
jgi:hypothetical protein